MKVIKFADELVPLVLNGSKTSTWRLFDDKDLSDGDELEFRKFSDGSMFANAKIINVITKKFIDLTDDDKNGHGDFLNDIEMYKTFANFYKVDVGPQTELKIIRFEIKNN